MKYSPQNFFQKISKDSHFIRIEKRKASIEITVVIPTFNRKKMVIQCLDSLAGQNISPEIFEVVLVDDCSTDGTLKAVESWAAKGGKKINLSLISNKKNYGPSITRNIGILNSRGSLIAFTDDDCVVPEDWLENFKREMDSNPGLAGIGGWKIPQGDAKGYSLLDRFILWRRWTYMEKSFVSRQTSPFNNCGDTANVCYRKEALISAGGFDPGFNYLEDWELKYRMHSMNFLLKYDPRMVWHTDRTNFWQYARHHYNFGREYSTIKKKYGHSRKSLYSFWDLLPLVLRDIKIFSGNKKFFEGSPAHFFIILASLFTNFFLWLGESSLRLKKILQNKPNSRE